MDSFTPQKRREIMQAVRRSKTRPELHLAELLSQFNIEFLQNVTSLPGKPDFWLPKYKLAVFVNGCFWHGHSRCIKGRSWPKTNTVYWKEKLARNHRRDVRVARSLRAQGIGVYTVWECELSKKQWPRRLLTRLHVGHFVN